MEPLTLYKLMILYLLKAVRYPLSHDQLSAFMLEKEYCNFFTLQQACSELLDAHLMREESFQNYTRFLITREGEDTLTFFGDAISKEIREDMDEYLQGNMIKLRDESLTACGYRENGKGEYDVDLEIREGRDILLKLTLTVPSEQQAKLISDGWPKKNQKVYEDIMKELLGN